MCVVLRYVVYLCGGWGRPWGRVLSCLARSETGSCPESSTCWSSDCSWLSSCLHNYNRTCTCMYTHACYMHSLLIKVVPHLSRILFLLISLSASICSVTWQENATASSKKFCHSWRHNKRERNWCIIYYLTHEPHHTNTMYIRIIVCWYIYISDIHKLLYIAIFIRWREKQQQKSTRESMKNDQIRNMGTQWMLIQEHAKVEFIHCNTEIPLIKFELQWPLNFKMGTTKKH